MVGLVLAEQQRRRVPSGPGTGQQLELAQEGMVDADRGRPAWRPAPAWAALTSHDQVLRNQAVGSTCSVSASGPALVTWIDIRRSWGSALA